MIDKLDIEYIEKRLNKGIKVFVCETLDSTNNHCKRIINDYNFSKFIVTCEEQTAGKGRLGRSFYSPKYTGIYLSYLVKLKEINQTVTTITSLTSVVITQVLEEMFKVNLKIKWVNDIYYLDKKVCGILAESVCINDDVYLIIGIGINVSTNIFPNDIKDTAISISNSNQSYFKVENLRNELIVRITNKIDDYLENDYYKLENIRKDYMNFYKEHSNVLGREIIFTENGKTKEGYVMGITDNGELVIKSVEEMIVLRTGEITIRLK